MTRLMDESRLDQYPEPDYLPNGCRAHAISKQFADGRPRLLLNVRLALSFPWPGLGRKTENCLFSTFYFDIEKRDTQLMELG